MTKIIVAPRKYESEEVIGRFIDESHFDTLINEDTDCYIPDISVGGSPLDENRIAFKFRKNYFSAEDQKAAYDGLRAAARETENRGLASGILEGHTTEEGRIARAFVTNYQHDMLEAIDEASIATVVDDDPIDKIRTKYPTKESRELVTGNGKHTVWVYARFDPSFNFEVWIDGLRGKTKAERHAEVKTVSGYISTSTYGNKVRSGIAGWFDRYPRIPFGRATGYTRDHYEDFIKAYPFLKRLANGFKELLPVRYANQKAASDSIDPAFVIPETPFTTITVNSTFRTAAHRDAGDYTQGMSNLLVLSNDGNYTGGYLVFPEYRIAVNVRPGDLLLVNNHDIIHGNTPINLNSPESERVSLVVYLREGMLSLGTYEYEKAREDFVESRRLDPKHPEQRYKWNGISPGLWDSNEWIEYLLAKPNGEQMLKQYHYDLWEARFNTTTLEDFFG